MQQFNATFFENAILHFPHIYSLPAKRPQRVTLAFPLLLPVIIRKDHDLHTMIKLELNANQHFLRGDSQSVALSLHMVCR